MTDQDWAYIGRKADGEVCCTAVIDHRWAKDTQKEVSKWLRDGLTIERVPVEWVRKYFHTKQPYLPEPEQYDNDGVKSP